MEQDSFLQSPLFIGSVTTLVGVASLAAYKLLFNKKSAVALNPTIFQSFALEKKTIVSHDTRIFRFALHSPEQRLGLPIGQHMYLKATIDGADVQRAYTPISSNDDLGCFELLIKVYARGVHPKFPEGGKMSQHLDAMQLGDTILVKGPTGRFEYIGDGRYTVRRGGKDAQPGPARRVKRIGMVAGGTGITPMLQVIRAVLKDPHDTTEMALVFGNQTEEDILLRPELEECAKDKRFRVYYTLDRPTQTWQGGKGFVTYEMLKEHLFEPSSEDDCIVLLCGPAPMVNFACKPNLEKMGFKAEQMFSF